jgi:hypothetical protein
MFDLSRDNAEIMVRNFNNKVWANVPVVMGHPDLELLQAFPEMILGRVQSLELTEQGVTAEFAVEDYTASLIDSSKIFDVSMSFWTDFYDERSGEWVGITLQHLGLVLEPYMNNLDPFVKTEGAFSAFAKEAVCFSKNGEEKKSTKVTFISKENMTREDKKPDEQGTENFGSGASTQVSLSKAEYEALKEASNQSAQFAKRIEEMELEADRRDVEINLSSVILSDKNPTGKIPGKFSAEVEAFLAKISKDARADFTKLIEKIDIPGVNFSKAKGDGQDVDAFSARLKELSASGKKKAEIDKLLFKEFPTEFTSYVIDQKNNLKA